MNNAPDGFSGGLRLVAGDSDLFAHQGVSKSGLSYVRPPYERDKACPELVSHLLLSPQLPAQRAI